MECCVKVFSGAVTENKRIFYKKTDISEIMIMKFDSSNWITIASCCSRRWPTWELPLHTHDGYDLFFVCSGHTKMRLRDGQILDMNPNSYILLNGGIPHRLLVHPQDNCHMIMCKLKQCDGKERCFNYDALERICPGISDMFNGEIMMTQGEDKSGLLFSQLSVLVSYVSSAISSNYEIPTEIIDLQLAASLIKIFTSRICVNDTHNLYASNYVEKAIYYIASNFANDISVGSIAAACGISDSYLQRLFVKSRGETLTSHILKLRIESAKRLLENTSYSMIEIAIDTGFSNRQHFTRCFKAITGITPGKYREANAKNNIRSVFSSDKPE